MSFTVSIGSSFNAKEHALKAIICIYLALDGLKVDYPNENQRDLAKGHNTRATAHGDPDFFLKYQQKCHTNSFKITIKLRVKVGVHSSNNCLRDNVIKMRNGKVNSSRDAKFLAINSDPALLTTQGMKTISGIFSIFVMNVWSIVVQHKCQAPAQA